MIAPIPMHTPPSTEMQLAQRRSVQGTERATSSGSGRGSSSYTATRVLPTGQHNVPLTFMDYEFDLVHTPIIDQIMEYEDTADGGALTRALIVDEVSQALVALANDQNLFSTLFSTESQHTSALHPQKEYKKKDLRDIREWTYASHCYKQFIECRNAQ